MNVQRTVRGFAAAGFAGILLEDQVAPKSCGHVRGKAVVPRAEAVARIRAAADARCAPGTWASAEAHRMFSVGCRTLETWTRVPLAGLQQVAPPLLVQCDCIWAEQKRPVTAINSPSVLLSATVSCYAEFA